MDSAPVANGSITLAALITAFPDAQVVGGKVMIGSGDAVTVIGRMGEGLVLNETGRSLMAQKPTAPEAPAPRISRRPKST